MSKTILTRSGKLFDYMAPTADMVELDDIAHALSNLCRFTGHCDRFYSVAEHSVLVSRLVPNDLALAGLLHDATEAYCGDVNSPLKSLLGAYRAIEARVAAVIEEKFKVKFGHPFVKNADTLAYLAERCALMPELPADHPEHEELRAFGEAKMHGNQLVLKVGSILVRPIIRGLEPSDSYFAFKKRFAEITSW